MDFSDRVGLEPATDLRNRLKVLCEEAGLDVVASRMIMRREDTMEESYRFVFVWAHEPGWTRTLPDHRKDQALPEGADHQVQIQAVIPLSGQWPETVTVSCGASSQVGELWDKPTLRTGTTKLVDLSGFLQKVVSQQKTIITERERGGKGPWEFGDMRWKEVGIDFYQD